MKIPSLASVRTSNAVAIGGEETTFFRADRGFTLSYADGWLTIRNQHGEALVPDSNIDCMSIK